MIRTPNPVTQLLHRLGDKSLPHRSFLVAGCALTTPTSVLALLPLRTVVSVLPVLTLLSGLFVITAFVGCDQREEQRKPVQPTVVVRLVHDPEVRALLSSAKDKFYLKNKTLSDGTSLALELIPELNVPAARRLASGELKAEAWITPVKSLADYANSSVAPLGAHQIECRPLFRTPMIIAASAQLASQLHATDGQVSWNALIDQIRTENGLSGNSPIGYSHGFPELSASGPMVLNFLTRLSLGARASADNELINSTGNEAIPDSVIKQLQDWERLVSHYSLSESYLLERVSRSSLKRVYLTLASEQQLKSFQRNQRADAPKIIGLFPEEGTIWNTYQLCRSDAPWATAAHRSVISSFADFFSSPEGAALPENFGFRSLQPAASNNDPVPGDLGELSGKQFGELLTRWPKDIMKPGALMVVLDGSGSMEGDSLRASKESLRNLLPRLNARDKIGLETFASDTKSLLPVGSKIDEVFSAIEELRAVGGSAAYDALKVGIDGLSAPGLSGYRRTLLMITDGEGANSELSLQGIQDYLSARLARYDINVLIIAIKREGADYSDLERIARGANGYFRIATPAELVTAIQDAMRNV